MRYISTRGGISPIPFSEAVMMGLATDGGLLLPEDIIPAGPAELENWRGLSYQELACEVISRFIDDIPAADLRRLIERSYAGFSHSRITPLVGVGDLQILELFHGPTLAFKDVALQFLGNVFEYLLKKSGGRMNILGATSGDTGSAAIHGVRGKDNINIFILHPHKRVSPVQELQMTTVTDANVFNLAIKGTFDDGQAIVKSIFNDISFKERFKLGAVNSINWARILAQVVYYIYAALRLGGAGEPVDFAVPTGNFGDIFAGYVARKIMPEKIRRLILATNENDLLARFVNRGDYSVGEVKQTCSPSMDIQVASNFERYLFMLFDCDPDRTRSAMEDFAISGKMMLPERLHQKVRKEFLAGRVTEEEIHQEIARVYNDDKYLMDPHTAVGVRAARGLKDAGVPMVCLATAHPAKFGEAVARAIGTPVELPPPLAELDGLPIRCRELAADEGLVMEFIKEHAG